MPVTAISTRQASTRLTITTNGGETVNLVQMDSSTTTLQPGTSFVDVGPGVFKVASTNPITVSGNPSDLVVLTNTTKGDPWPDPSALRVSTDLASKLQQFFSDAKSATVE